MQVLVGVDASALRAVQSVSHIARFARTPVQRLVLDSFVTQVADRLSGALILRSENPRLRSTHDCCSRCRVLADALERSMATDLEKRVAYLRAAVEERLLDRPSLGAAIRRRIRTAPGHRPPTAREVCTTFGISRASLEREFQSELGVSASEFIRAVRVRNVLRLIRAGNKVEYATLAVGWRSKSSFYRALGDTRKMSRKMR